MLISPPFLPLRHANQSDDDWVDMAMAQPGARALETTAREGSFPVSASLMWHNGIHIQAPSEGHGHAPVRAIADGTITFARAGKAMNDDKDDAQNYGGGDAEWSDNGIVIIEHQAEIGASNDAVSRATRFTFYSLYMHLSALSVGDISPGDAPKPVTRKAVLGQPGRIYGHAGQIHFEICCNHASLQTLLGRRPGWRENDPVATPTADGRTDTVFGRLFFYLGAGTPTRSSRPTTHTREPQGGASAATDHFTPNTLGKPQWLALHYDRGHATFLSYDLRGRQIGTALRDPESVLPDKQDAHRGKHPQPDTEYSLYQQANHRHHSLDAAHQGTSSPSGWYELLRFGRNLGHGTGIDRLPADAAHWRCIPTAGGCVWADLNAPGTFKFSDADFLPVAGWNCFDDDPRPDNQLCESYALRRLLRDPKESRSHSEQQVAREERRMLGRQLGEPSNRRLLRRAICRFPSEWDQKDIEQRHQWLNDAEAGYGLHEPKAWALFVRHLRAMSFADLPQGYLQANWRFHPAEFVAVLRQCGWLDDHEMARIYKESIYANVGKTGQEYRNRYRITINRSLSKYRINAPFRAAHFFGQVAQESYFFMITRESSVGVEHALKNDHLSIQPEILSYLTITPSNAHHLQYFTTRANYEGRLNLGNTDAGDGIKFRGRGMKQLTGRFNYSEYRVYRGWLATASYDHLWFRNKTQGPSIPDPQRAANDTFTAVDTASYYCVAHHIPELADAGVREDVSIAISHAINPGERPPARNRWIQTLEAYKVLGDE